MADGGNITPGPGLPTDPACYNHVPVCPTGYVIALDGDGCWRCKPAGSGTGDYPVVIGPPPANANCIYLQDGCYFCGDTIYCPDASGGCGTGGGTGGGPGGGGTGGGPGGGTQCPTGTACKMHDDTIVDAATRQPLQKDPDCKQVGYIFVPTYYGVEPDQIPYCDTIDKPCPTPPASKVCDDCVKDALNAINDTLRKLVDKHGDCFDEQGNIAASCLANIAKQIGDYLFPAAKSCDECCERIKMGLATATSCQASFAGCECQRCTEKCESYQEGQCCSTCGQAECTCKDSKCIPKETPTVKWTAYCDHTTGVNLPTNTGQPPTIPGNWTKGGTYDNETDALLETCDQVTQPPPSGPPITPPPLPPTEYPDADIMQGVCEISRYANRQLATQILTEASDVNVNARAINIIGDVAGQIGHVGGGSVAAVSSAIGGLAQYFGGAFSIELGADIISTASGLAPNAILPAVQTLGAIGIAEKWMNCEVPQAKLPIEYALNAATRPRIYSPEQAITAHLVGALPRDYIDRYFAAAGYCEFQSEALIDAAVAKPVPAELLRLYRWGTYTVDQYNSGMRRLGYTDQKIVDDLYSTSFVRPSLGEMLHMMIRDADNAKVKSTFDFDVRFEDKFGPQIKEWCEQQGIQEDVVRMAYRSHWDIPSKTELFEFWRRLRNLPVGTPGRITEDELKAALTHNNILPHWFDSYMLTLYNPISRIDIRRGYTIGAISDDQARNAFQQIGYSDDNVDLLMKFMKQLKDQSASKHRTIKLWQEGQAAIEQVTADMRVDGYTDEQISSAIRLAGYSFKSGKIAASYLRGDLNTDQFVARLSGHGVQQDTINSIVEELGYGIKYDDAISAYEAGIISRSVALNRLNAFGVNGNVAANKLDAIDDKLDAKRAVRCISAIRKRYLLGELDKDAAAGQLITAGIINETAQQTVGGWECEIKARNKTIPTQTLCGWLARGSITPEDFYNRMVKLGHSEDDANQLLVDCLSRINVKMAQATAKQMREDQAKADKAAAKARRNAALVQAQLAQAERARKALASLKAKRQGQLLHAAGLVMKGCDCVEMDAIGAVNTAVDQLQQVYGLTLDESIKIAVQASENNWGGKAQDYVDKAMALGELLVSTEAETGVPQT